MNRIDRLIQQAGLPKTVFQPLQPESAAMPASQTWTEQAVYAITERLQAPDWTAGPAGLITVPPGVDKLPLMEELIRRLAKNRGSLPVLVLTSTPDLASGYAEGLKQILGESYPVQLADSPSELMSRVSISGSITAASTHSLPGWNRAFSTLKDTEISAPLSHPLLVVAEEAAHRNWRRICPSIGRCFPNAALLGLTIDCASPAQLLKEFGPVVYAYSCTQALQDRAVKRVSYQQVRSHLKGSSNWTQQIADWITVQENKQKNSAMLLCNDIETALSLFARLHSSLGAERLRVHVPYLFRSSRQDVKLYRQLPKKSRWDGTRFPGMFIICTAIISNLPVDTVYLAKQTNRFTALSILAALAMDQKTGRLVDFYDHRKLLKETDQGLFNEELPFILSSQPDGRLRILRKQLTDALSGHQYHELEALLAQISAASPEEGERLSSQLAFLSPANTAPAHWTEYWAQHESLLAWKSDLWCILSQDSACVWKEADCLDSAVREGDGGSERPRREPEPGPLPVPAAHIDELPQQWGARLEQATCQLIRELFDLSDGTALKDLHRQHNGFQYGFDISFTYQDAFGVEVTCLLECKDHQNNLIQEAYVSAKLSSAQDMNRVIDHWILLSPNSTASNSLNMAYQKWLATKKWYPILRYPVLDA